MSTILEKLFVKRRQERSEQAASWEQFVAQVADEKIGVDEADIALKKFGKSEVELAKAIELRKKLVQARAEVASETDLQSEIELLGNEIKKANDLASAEIEAIRRKCVEQTNVMLARSNALQAKLSGIGNARVFLMENCRLPEDVSEKLAELHRETAALLRQREHVGELKTNHNATGSLTKERRARFDSELSDIEVQLKAISEQAAELEWSHLL